jgi:hypothetical protein
VRVPRAPLGVVSLGDVVVTFGLIVIAPVVYLVLPLPVVAVVFSLAAANALYTLFAAAANKRSIAVKRALAALVTATWLGADITSVWLLGATHPGATAINDVLLVVLVIGVCLIWTQGGLRARDATILIAAVGVYDLIATAVLPLTHDMVTRLASIPFAPVIAWGTNDESRNMAIGLGDVLLAALFPIVQRKAFGQTAGLRALAVSGGTLTLLVGLGAAGALGRGFPVMIALAPLVTIQYLYYRHRRLADTHRHDQFARPLESTRTLELTERAFDVGPHRLAIDLRQASQHLVQGTE